MGTPRLVHPPMLPWQPCARTSERRRLERTWGTLMPWRLGDGETSIWLGDFRGISMGGTILFLILWGFLGFVCGICRICLAIIGVLAGRKLGVTSNKQQPGILWGCNGEFSWGAPHPQLLDRDQQDVWFIAFCHMIGTQPRRQGCNCITQT